jgi:hypothetical protein
MWIFWIILALLLLLSRTKFEVRHDIELNAPIQKVWEAVIDFNNYHRWNSQLSYLGGEVAPGAQLHLKLAVAGTDPYEFKPTISHWQQQALFGWIAHTGGIPRLFDGEHFFELTELAGGKTLLVNREEYRGILSPIMQRLPMMKLAPQGFERMNLELKSYLENFLHG